MDIILVQMLTFMAVVLFVLGVKTALGGKKPEERITSKPAIFAMFAAEIGAFSRFVSTPVGQISPGKTRQIQNDLMAAALPVEVGEIRGLQGLAALVLAAAGSILIFIMSLNPVATILGFFFFGYLGWMYPVIWLAGVARRRKEEMSRSLPYAIDLITVAMQAGQDIGAAIRHLVQEGPAGPLAQEFGIMLRQTTLGKSRVEAFKAMADRIQLDEFRSLVTAVIQSTEMGASISQTMKIQAEEIRRVRHHKAERQAARAPSLMLIPTALFILPAVFIIIFTPIILRMTSSGMSNFAGK